MRLDEFDHGPANDMGGNIVAFASLMKLVRELRPVPEVLARAVATGALAGLAAGVLDALWSWGAAAQFVPCTNVTVSAADMFVPASVTVSGTPAIAVDGATLERVGTVCVCVAQCTRTTRIRVNCRCAVTPHQPIPHTHTHTQCNKSPHTTHAQSR